MRRLLSIAMGFTVVAALGALAQVPTTSTTGTPDAASANPAPPAPQPPAPEVYSRDNVAPDMLSASIEALNAQTHEAAYRAALSEIRETLVKMRMAALIMVYKQQMIEQARTALGLQEAPLHDSEAQVRIHTQALKMHGIELDLPGLPPGYHETGLPMTPGSLLRLQPQGPLR